MVDGWVAGWMDGWMNHTPLALQPPPLSNSVAKPAAAALATAVLKELTYEEPRERLMTPGPGGALRGPAWEEQKRVMNAGCFGPSVFYTITIVICYKYIFIYLVTPSHV